MNLVLQDYYQFIGYPIHIVHVGLVYVSIELLNLFMSNNQFQSAEAPTSSKPAKLKISKGSELIVKLFLLPYRLRGANIPNKGAEFRYVNFLCCFLVVSILGCGL